MDDDSRRDSSSSRYRSTTVLLKAIRGSEQYHADEVVDCKSIGSLRLRRPKSVQDGALDEIQIYGRRTRFGVCLSLLRRIDKRSPYPLVKSTQIPSFDGNAV